MSYDIDRGLKICAAFYPDCIACPLQANCVLCIIEVLPEKFEEEE
jgi:adenine-specific DNA glycosylase